MSNAGADGDQGWTTPAHAELRANLAYARNLIEGGQHLKHLRVGAFDVDDLYRAAWVQAVSALDQWVHRELYARALGFALRSDVPRPHKFLTLKIPMQMFEDVHHRRHTLDVSFGAHLREQFGYQSFQAPDKIKDALAYVSEVQLWPAVAKRLTTEAGRQMTPQDVQATLKDIVDRRNRIAHEADRDPDQLHAKRPISAREATATVDRVEQITIAILHALGPPVVAIDQTDTDVPNHDELPQPETVTETNSPAATDKPVRPQTTKQDLYWRFWSKLEPVVRIRGWSKSAAPAQSWWNLPAGVTGVTWAMSFTRPGCRSELYFEDSDAATNLARWQILADQRAKIMARFGDDLVFDDMPGMKGCRIGAILIGPSVYDRVLWPDVLRWMEDTQVRLRSAIASVGGVPSLTAPPGG